MQISGIRARELYAALAAPMRSRGNVGYTEFFHTGSEVQRITAVEVLTNTEQRGITLLHGHAAGWVEGVAAPVLEGKDPLGIRHCRRALERAVAAAPEERASRGHVNRLEFALWDLAGKQVGLPLYRLLGGTDPTVEVYAGGGSLCWNPLPLLVEETRQLLERGFRAFKIKIGHGPEEDARIIRALRETAGPDVRIMVDANRAYDLPGALALCPVLEECGVYWLEEPLVYDDPAAWRALRESTHVHVTGGEGYSRLSQAAEALRERIVSILQCDAGAFGLEALLAIGSMASEEGVALTPHSCNSVIGFVVACHLQRALPNAEIQEFETFDSPFIHSLFGERPVLRDGKVWLSEAPGLGVTLDEDTVKRFRSPS